MALLLKGARLVDPQAGLDKVGDLLVRDGKIAEVGESLHGGAGDEPGEEIEVRDLAGKVVVPGLVDVHVHLRDPGQEHKEDIRTGTRAAAHGGYTGVCCMPNTTPAIDNGAMVDYVNRRAAEVGKCRVYVSGACTRARAGEALAEMGDMVAHGACAFTDDGAGVPTAGMMRRVMDYANQFGLVVMSHCQDATLSGKGQVNEGAASTRLGLAGWPAAAEEVQIARDIAICRLTGTRLHIQHITTAHGLDLVRRAKAEGLPVTCEATPHHLFLNEDAIDDTYNTALKVNPPLRTQADSDALIAGILDGTVDCISTDHAPHAPWEKDLEFEEAPFGMTGIETALGLVATQLVHTGLIDWGRLVELMAASPRRILSLDAVTLAPGSVADLTVIDPDAEWTVSAEDFESKSQNSGFLGARLKGRATDVYVGGIATMKDGEVVE